MTRSVIYPGTFDPVTYGHIDLIKRSLKIFEKIYIAVALNENKNPLFTANERLKLIEGSLENTENLELETFSGLLIDYACEKEVPLVLRGIRAFADFEYEFQMALTNRKIKKEVDTIFMMPDEQYSYISSRMIKEICRMGGEVTAFVPPLVEEALKKKLLNS